MVKMLLMLMVEKFIMDTIINMDTKVLALEELKFALNFSKKEAIMIL